MSEVSFGDTCVTLGLLNSVQIEDLRRDVGDGAALAELAVERGWLDDDAVAHAWAQLFRLNMVPAERVDRLSVAPMILQILPADLIRQHLLVPTFLDAERRVLSLLTADPTAIEALKAAQTTSGASRLRLFVAPRRSIRSLLDRILPRAQPAPARNAISHEQRPVTVALETSPEYAALLRQIGSFESSQVEVCTTPGQVSALLQAGRAGRVLYRAAIAREIDADLAVWRESWADRPIGAVDGWGPASRYAISYDKARTFLLELLELVVVGEAEAGSPGDRVRRTNRLVKEIGAVLDLPAEVRDTLQIAALLADGADLSRAAGREPQGPLASARAMIQQLESPYPVTELFDTLERRLSGRESPGRHLGAEVLYTARAAVQVGVAPGEDPVSRLGADAARHHGPVLHALTEVLRRDGLRSQVATAGGSSVVLVAERDPRFVEQARSRLSVAGMSVVTSADAADTHRQAALVRPAALLLSASLPGMSNFDLLDRLRDDTRTQELPVIVMGEHGQNLATALERGAEDVMERPVNWELLLARLRRAVGRRTSAAATTAAISGQLAELSLVDLLQTLMLSARTAVVRVAAGAESGEVHVREGRLVAAEIGPWLGEEALHALVDLPEGRFEVRFRDGGLTNLKGSSEFLLLEAIRRRDERRGA